MIEIIILGYADKRVFFENDSRWRHKEERKKKLIRDFGTSNILFVQRYLKLIPKVHLNEVGFINKMKGMHKPLFLHSHHDYTYVMMMMMIITIESAIVVRLFKANCMALNCHYTYYI